MDVNFPNHGSRVQISAVGSKCRDSYLRVIPETNIYGGDAKGAVAFRCDFCGADNDERTFFRLYQVPEDPKARPKVPVDGQHQLVQLGIPGERVHGVRYGDCIFVLKSLQDDGEVGEDDPIYAMKFDYLDGIEGNTTADKDQPPSPDIISKSLQHAIEFQLIYKSYGRFVIRVPKAQDEDSHLYLSVNYEGRISRQRLAGEDLYTKPLMYFHILTTNQPDTPYRIPRNPVPTPRMLLASIPGPASTPLHRPAITNSGTNRFRMGMLCNCWRRNRNTGESTSRLTPSHNITGDSVSADGIQNMAVDTGTNT